MQISKDQIILIVSVLTILIFGILYLIGLAYTSNIIFKGDVYREYEDKDGKITYNKMLNKDELNVARIYMFFSICITIAGCFYIFYKIDRTYKNKFFELIKSDK